MQTNVPIDSPHTWSDTDDPVDLTSEASFPASDPPAWASGQSLDEQKAHRLPEADEKPGRKPVAERAHVRQRAP